MTYTCIKLLHAIGATDPIYAALHKNDKAEIVRITKEALSFGFITVPGETKSKETCMAYLKKAKQIATSNQSAYDLIVPLCNKALSWAPIGSKEMMFAYADRSEAMFCTKSYELCQTDIMKCLSMGCPTGLAKKLSKLKDDAKQARIQDFLSGKPADTVNRDSSFLDITFKNIDVPCASADVTFVNRSGAKQATADDTIKVGSVVAIERAFVTCVGEEHQAITCYYCFRRTPCLHPCDNCQAMFCSNLCRDRSMREYHRIECQIIGYLGLSYFETHNTLVTRTAIKLSLELGWDELIKASEDIGASRMKSATVKQTYSSEDPLSMLSYDDDVNYFEGKMFNGSTHCAKIMYHLERVHDYLPTETSKRVAATKALSRIMLHLYVTFTKTVPIHCMSPRIYLSCSNSLRPQYTIDSVQKNYGWFAMTSKLRHSCEPNLMMVGLKDTVMLVASRTINEGEELTISYIDHFYSFDGGNRSPDRPYRRATELFLKTGHVCLNCVVCKEDWDKDSLIEIVMTEEQALLVEKLENIVFNTYNIRNHHNTICEILDKFPLGSDYHKNAYKRLLMYFCDYIA